jgi:hypothetical protein
MSNIERVRRAICAQCPSPCEQPRPEDPEAACPIGRWRARRGPGPAGASPASRPATMPRQHLAAEPFAFWRLWREIHQRPHAVEALDPLAEMAWLRAIAARLPCGPRRTHYLERLGANPPDLGTRDGYFAWTVALHNAVNVTRGRDEWTLCKSIARWLKSA